MATEQELFNLYGDMQTCIFVKSPKGEVIKLVRGSDPTVYMERGFIGSNREEFIEYMTTPTAKTKQEQEEKPKRGKASRG